MNGQQVGEFGRDDWAVQSAKSRPAGELGSRDGISLDLEGVNAVGGAVNMSEPTPLGSERAMQIVAENKLRAAIEAGEFDNLPGLGKPSPLIDEPYDPFWWLWWTGPGEFACGSATDGSVEAK